MGRPANDLGPPTDRFSHDLPTPDADIATSADVDPAREPEAVSSPPLQNDPPWYEALENRTPPPVQAAEPLPSPARAPEWPPAWLRVVQPEPEPVAVPAPVETAPEETRSPGEYAHAFGLTMAAALDHAAESDAAGYSENERPPVQRPLITRAPRSRPLAAKPVENGPVESGPVENGSAPSSLASEGQTPVAKPVDVMDAPLFGSIGGTAARPPRSTRAARPSFSTRSEDHPDAAARTERAAERALPGTVYLLYLTGFLVVPAVLGVVLALNGKSRAPAWLQSHYLFQIRTFWIGCAGAAVAAALAVSSLQATEFAGLALMMLLVLWLLLRAAAGYARLLKLRVHPNPRTWLI